VASGPRRQWRADSGGGGRGYNTVKGPANYCLSPRVGYTYYIYIYAQYIHELEYIYTHGLRVRLIFHKSAWLSPEIVFRAGHYVIYVCILYIYIICMLYARVAARKFYSCKIFFITRGMSAAELHYMYMRIIGHRRFASPVYCLLSCGTDNIIYIAYDIRSPSTRSDDFRNRNIYDAAALVWPEDERRETI